MTTAKVSDRGRITLPSFVRRALGLERGDEVRFVRTAPNTFLLQAPDGTPAGLDTVSTDAMLRAMQRAMHEERYRLWRGQTDVEPDKQAKRTQKTKPQAATA